MKRALALAGAAAMALGAGITASATSPFSGTISLACVPAGQHQTVSVSTTAGSLVAITVSPGAGSKVAVAGASGVVSTTWTIPATATGAGHVTIQDFTQSGLATGSGNFAITGANATPCPTVSPSGVPINGSLVDTTQVSNGVKKTCAAGVSGDAAFTVTLQYSEFSAVIVPVSLPVTCNGGVKNLPVLPVGTHVTFHESTLPAHAAAAADVHATVASGAVIVINNTAVVVLALTGDGSGRAGLLWPAILIGMVLFVAGVGLLRRRGA